MDKRFSAASALLTLLTAAALAGCGSTPLASEFTLGSPDLRDGRFDNRFVLNGFGCNGDNVSPALVWRNAPAGSRSFALQVHDPDAPTASA